LHIVDITIPWDLDQDNRDQLESRSLSTYSRVRLVTSVRHEQQKGFEHINMELTRKIDAPAACQEGHTFGRNALETNRCTYALQRVLDAAPNTTKSRPSSHHPFDTLVTRGQELRDLQKSQGRVPEPQRKSPTWTRRRHSFLGCTSILDGLCHNQSTGDDHIGIPSARLWYSSGCLCGFMHADVGEKRDAYRDTITQSANLTV